jgi:hypothetical protein
MRGYLKANAVAIRELLERHLNANLGSYSGQDLRTVALRSYFDTGRRLGSFADLLDDVLNPSEHGPRIDPYQAFHIGAANAGDRLNQRPMNGPDAMPPTAALEARYYGQPMHVEPPRMRNFSDWAMLERDSNALVAATYAIDGTAYMAHLLERDPLGNPIIAALTSIATSQSDQRHRYIQPLAMAIFNYLHNYPAMYSSLADLLAPVSQLLQTPLLPDPQYLPPIYPPQQPGAWMPANPQPGGNHTQPTPYAAAGYAQQQPPQSASTHYPGDASQSQQPGHGWEASGSSGPGTGSSSNTRGRRGGGRRR